MAAKGIGNERRNLHSAHSRFVSRWQRLPAVTGSILDGYFGEFHSRLMPLVKQRDYPGAETLCNEYVALADAAKDPDAAAMFVGFLGHVLAFARRDADALAAYERAERYTPGDPQRKIATAQYLTQLGRSNDAWNKLAEAEPFLTTFPETYHWLNERGLAALASGRSSSAVECMKELAQEDRLAIIRTHGISLAYQVDLRLVSQLVAKGLARADCITYLRAAEELGSQKDDPREVEALKAVRDLLAKAEVGA